MEIWDLIRQHSAFSSGTHPEKICAFAWFLHTHKEQDRFSAADVRRCYDEAHLGQPRNLYSCLDSLLKRRPADLLKDKVGYRLARHVRERLDGELGKVETVIAIEKMLTDLPGQITDEGERLFLAEALTCYRHGAPRAAIVMAWNLAYDHLVRWILADPKRLAAFNTGIAGRNKRKAGIVIANREDFEELKESETIDIAGGLPGFSANMKRMLKEKLGRRNTYAHPSTLTIERPQVDDMISDLVNNVVLRLAL